MNGTSVEAFPELKRNTWCEIPNTHLLDASPKNLPVGRSIIAAWSGGAFDTKRDRLIVWGGGHGDYNGNEITGFDIRLKAEMLQRTGSYKFRGPPNKFAHLTP